MKEKPQGSTLLSIFFCRTLQKNYHGLKEATGTKELTDRNQGHS